jgi:hypothetical protein
VVAHLALGPVAAEGECLEVLGRYAGQLTVLQGHQGEGQLPGAAQCVDDELLAAAAMGRMQEGVCGQAFDGPDIGVILFT